jgi:hypothetical protein
MQEGQEFVIGGYECSDKPGRTICADLLDRIEALRTDTPTIEGVPRVDARRAVWVKPELGSVPIKGIPFRYGS